MRPATATIDLGALRHNLLRVKESARRSKIFAVVKADAYGHRLSLVLPALAGADAFAVACVEEAMLIRQAGIEKPILLLEGFFDADDLQACIDYSFWPVVHHWSQLDLLARTALRRSVRVWLKVDTGMHRLGFSTTEFESAWKKLLALEQVSSDIGLMTHFANADDVEDEQTRVQLARWNAATASVSGDRTSANSAGILGWSESHFDWVRPGIMLYGVSPFVRGTGVELNLRPAMTLQTRLIAVKTVAAGQSVGYGSAWTAPGETRIGIAAIGYGDGYPRHAPSGTPVLVDGISVPLVGRVSMDMIALDLSEHSGVAFGAPVVLWGRGLPVETVASYAGTIAYELLCSVKHRVSFSVLN